MQSPVSKKLEGRKGEVEGLAMTHPARFDSALSSNVFMLFMSFASIPLPARDMAENALLFERQPPR